MTKEEKALAKEEAKTADLEQRRAAEKAQRDVDFAQELLDTREREFKKAKEDGTDHALDVAWRNRLGARSRLTRAMKRKLALQQR